MSIIEKFNLRKDIFNTQMGNDIFEPFNKSVKLVKDQPAQFMGSINGIDVPAIATLRSAKLHRLSILDHVNRNSSDGKTSLIVTGTLRNVKIDLDIIIDGTKMSITDFLHQWWEAAENKKIERELFVSNLNNIGLNFESGMSMLFQQFGASQDGYDHAVSHMVNFGAYDDKPTTNNGGRIRHAYTFGDNNPGFDVLDMELNAADRGMSQTRQGFLNLVDSVLTNFERILELRKTATAIGEKLKDPKLAAKDSEKLKNEYNYYREQSRKWASNWGGAQYRVNTYPNHETRVSEPGKPVIIDQVNALCGRLSVVANDEVIPLNFWRNSTINTPATVNKAGQQERIVSEDIEPF